MDSSRPPIANRSLTGRRLIADWLPIDLQLKSGGFDRTVVALVAADFGRKAVAHRLQFMCDRSLTG